MDLSAYLAIFLDESRENLQQLNQHLLALEENPLERTHLDAIFRVAHTLKGMSATMGFQGIADLTHRMEELLDDLRQGGSAVSAEVLDTLFACLDSLEALVDGAATGRESPDVTPLLARLQAVRAGTPLAVETPDVAVPDTSGGAPGERPFSETETKTISEAVTMGYSAYDVLVFLMPGCLMKSLRVTLVMRAIEPLGTVIRTIPTVAEMEADAMGDTFRLTFITLEEEGVLRAAILGVAEISAVTLHPVQAGIDASHGTASSGAAPAQLSQSLQLNESERRIVGEASQQGLTAYGIEVALQPGTVLKSARAIIVVRQLESRGELIKIHPSPETIEKEDFGDQFGVVVLSRDPAGALKAMVEGIAEVQAVTIHAIEVAPPKAEKKEDLARDKDAGSQKGKAAATIRVDTEKLDELMNLMGELVISRTRLNQLAAQYQATDMAQAVQQLTTITTDLQTVAMKLRMVSIEHVFNRFPRMVRDLGKTLKKEINLTITGQDTELDRTVIDMIGDPLVHLIRNSADHGLETPEERLVRGKSQSGQIQLDAKQEGGMVVVTVFDDGRGIDPTRIRAKAIEKRIITPEQSAVMDDWDAVQCIFAPGFSTRDEANEISGRGVGLDAVKELVSHMGGVIELHTEVGVGSRFSIKLPLTLAIMQALLTRVHNEVYAIPLSAVEEAVSITQAQIKSVQSRPVMVLRGETIPLIHLTERLQVPANGKEAEEEMPVVIVNNTSTAKANTKAGLVVSTLIGQEEIVIKPLSRTVRTSSLIAGAATLGDGSIALILNTPSLS